MTAFVDTCVVRYSQKTYKTWRKFREEVPTFGGWEEADIVRQIEVNPLETLKEPGHEATYVEALACSDIEELALQGVVSLVWTGETHLETVLNSTLGDPRPTMLRLIQSVNPPVDYQRHLDPIAIIPFLRSINNPCYDKWKKALGVITDSKRERNQLMDAWHLWTAEHNNCECFVSADMKMIKSIRSRKTQTAMKIFSPTEFLSYVATNN